MEFRTATYSQGPFVMNGCPPHQESNEYESCGTTMKKQQMMSAQEPFSERYFSSTPSPVPDSLSLSSPSSALYPQLDPTPIDPQQMHVVDRLPLESSTIYRNDLCTLQFLRQTFGDSAAARSTSRTTSDDTTTSMPLYEITSDHLYHQQSYQEGQSSGLACLPPDTTRRSFGNQDLGAGAMNMSSTNSSYAMMVQNDTNNNSTCKEGKIMFDPYSGRIQGEGVNDGNDNNGNTMMMMLMMAQQQNENETIQSVPSAPRTMAAQKEVIPDQATALSNASALNAAADASVVQKKMNDDKNRKKDDSADKNQNKTNQTDPKKRIRRYRALNSGHWFQKFNELAKFKQEYGHTTVPYNNPRYQTLAQWVKRQRYQYKLMKEGNHSNLTDERHRALQELGFTWKAVSSATAAAKKATLLSNGTHNKNIAAGGQGAAKTMMMGK